MEKKLAEADSTGSSRQQQQQQQQHPSLVTDTAHAQTKQMGEAFGNLIGSIMSDGLLCLNVALGNQLQLFDRLEDASKEVGIDSQTLADSLGFKERYVREWLAAVVTADIVEVADGEGKFFLSKVGHVTTLDDP